MLQYITAAFARGERTIATITADFMQTVEHLYDHAAEHATQAADKTVEAGRLLDEASVHRDVGSKAHRIAANIEKLLEG